VHTTSEDPLHVPYDCDMPLDERDPNLGVPANGAGPWRFDFAFEHGCGGLEGFQSTFDSPVEAILRGDRATAAVGPTAASVTANTQPCSNVPPPSFDTCDAQYRWDATITLTPPAQSELRIEAVPSAPIVVGQRRFIAANLFPPWATARSYEFQMKRPSESRWTTIGEEPGPILRHHFRLAGHFQTRTIAHDANNGIITRRRMTTRASPIEVRFPDYFAIVRDRAVDNFTLYGWARTLALASEEWRQEVGFWITLDTCSTSYGHTPHSLGRPVGPREDAEIHLGPPPPDRLQPSHPPVNGCAISYTVASFHTHTPTEWRLPRGGHRPVGPSEEDREHSRNEKLPGVVFDYIGSPRGSGRIPFGYPRHSPAERYPAGFARRPTPR
jgi:hypothetical protein